jgi:hypothetical protein
MSCYCILEVLNTSIDTVEIGKKVKLGDGEPLESWEDLVAESHVYGNMKGASGKGGARVKDDQEISPAELTRAIEHKLGHLENTERDVLMPVMREYHDLFKYDRSGMLPCTSRGFHEIKTGDVRIIFNIFYINGLSFKITRPHRFLPTSLLALV